MKTGIFGATPATSSPAAKDVAPAMNGNRGPRVSFASPATTMPNSDDIRKALNPQA
jgi:hypothetical protein